MWLACYTQQEIADAVGVDKATASRELEDCCNLEALPKSNKLAALHEDAAEPEAGRGERLGVDPKTAHGDAISGVENSTPAPAVVTGADGKTYPATRPAVVTTNAKVPAGGMRRRPQDRRRGTRWAVA